MTGLGPSIADLSFPEIAQRLRILLGNRLVAYIGAATDTGSVRRWAEGESVPPCEVQQRLRAALVVAATVVEHDDRAVTQAWFQGANALLGDRAPAGVLRDCEDLERAFGEVLAAARAFAGGA